MQALQAQSAQATGEEGRRSLKAKSNGLDKALVADVLKRLADAQQLVQRAGDRSGYRVGGVLLTSVTSMLGVIEKPALKFWAANCQQEADQRAIEAWLSSGGSGSVGDILSRVKYAFQSYQKSAKDIGTEAHAVIEHLMKQQMGQLPADLPAPVVSNNASFVVSAFRRWAEQNEFTPLASEKVVYSTKSKVSGTFDLLVAVPKHPQLAGRLVIGDIKTGREIYEEAILQVLIYRGVFAEMLGLDAEKDMGSLIIRLPKDPSEPEMRVVVWDAAAYRAVLGLGAFCRWRKR